MRIPITLGSGGACLAAAVAITAHTHQLPAPVDANGDIRVMQHGATVDGSPVNERILPPSKTRSSRKDYSLASRFKHDGVVNVGGQVRAPGPYPFTPGLILYAAIQCAGGATEFGSMKRVIVTRKGKRQVYDLTDPKWTHTPLIANDTIEVPQKNVFGN